MIWPWVCNYLICCSNGLLIVSWTSISKGMKIVVKLVPCLSFLLSFDHLHSLPFSCPPSLPLLLSLSFSVWVANHPRRGARRDKVAAHCTFPLVLFLTITLVQGCCEKGERGWDSVQWPLRCAKTVGFPLSGGYSQYVRNTEHFHAPAPPS